MDACVGRRMISTLSTTHQTRVLCGSVAASRRSGRGKAGCALGTTSGHRQGLSTKRVLTRRRVVGTGARASSVSPGFGTKGKARSCSVVMKGLPETLFTIGTVAVLPLYGAMIGAPKAEMTQNAMRSHLPFMLMGALYAAAALVSLQSVDAKALVDVFFANTNGDGVMSIARHALTLLSGFLATAEPASCMWLHLLSLDLFVARHVYLDSLALNVPAAHSLTLCCMFGPCGYLAHTFTKAFMANLKGRRAAS